MENSRRPYGKATKTENNTAPPKNISYIMNTRNWWGPLTFIFIISVLGVGMIGFQIQKSG